MPRHWLSAKEQAGEERDDRLRWAYQAVMTQPATATAVEELGRLYDAAAGEYMSEQLDIPDLAKSADDYALTVVASTILNLDAALNK